MADNLLSESFLVAFERRAGFDESPSALPWLLSIATNLISKRARLEAVKPEWPREGATLLGYLDSTQEQMMAISAVPLPATGADSRGFPRFSWV
jgi:DNA-directed RNA polymerase specialized sigma24 family protein